jgi:hypothetical protein
MLMRVQKFGHDTIGEGEGLRVGPKRWCDLDVEVSDSGLWR